jgi:formylglycine-generating enzyme required for sulfatase activity
MGLRDEFRLARDVDRLAREAERLATRNTKAISLRNVVVLFAILAPALVAVEVVGFMLEPPVREAWTSVAFSIVMWSPLFLPFEFRTAYRAQRSGRLGSGLRTAILTWATLWSSWPLMILALTACAAGYAIARTPADRWLWPVYPVGFGGMAVLFLMARLAGALFAERTAREPERRGKVVAFAVDGEGCEFAIEDEGEHRDTTHWVTSEPAFVSTVRLAMATNTSIEVIGNLDESGRGTVKGVERAAATVCLAQDAKPWEQQGTEAGDEIVGPDGGKMVWVPAGGVIMGSPQGEGEDEEHPAHQVRITKGFWLGKCTVTNVQYRAYCQETGVRFPLFSRQGDDHPIVNVTWTEAKAYCQRYELDLPTEAQWEYAARGPEGHVHPWGNEWDPKKCCNRENQGPGGRTYPVGNFPAGASWCGALDMAGNVFQWCKDWYSEKYYAKSPDTDPRGPYRLGYWRGHRLLRGGSWFNDDPRVFRCSYRSHSDPTAGAHSIGFRCSRTP